MPPKTHSLLIAPLLLAACAGTPAPVAETAPQSQPEHTRELAQLEEENEHLESRVRELEGRLSLSRAEARDLRETATERSAPAEREIVRIGSRAGAAIAAAAAEASWDEPGEEPFGIEQSDVDDGTPRPVLRLYGAPAMAPLDTSTPLVLPSAPPGVPTGLPLAALPAPPGAFAAAAPQRAASAPAPRARRTDQAAVTAYQQALTHVRDRRFEDALRAFDDFLRSHPRHPYAASAVYWQGEVHYAMRDYGRALSRFSRVVDEYPRATKVADSLFKIGLCHKRMGRERAAHRFFERVRRQFPDSVAARLSVQEDA